MKMEETVEVVRGRERESYSLENKVALKKDATTVSYVNILNCWTVWRESSSLFKQEERKEYIK